MEEEEKAPSTPKQSLKREAPYDSATLDSARGLRVADKKAPRRAVVLGSGANKAAAGVVTNLGASLAKVQRDTPRSSGRDATKTFEEMLPPPAEEDVAAAYTSIGLRENLSAAVEAVVSGMRSLWSSATRQKDRIFARKAEEEAVDWALMPVEDRVLVVRAADQASTDTKAYLKKVKTLSKAKLAKFDAAGAALAGFRGRLATAATKKNQTVILRCGVRGKLAKPPRTGCFSIVLDADVPGKGLAGQIGSFRTVEVDPQYVLPSQGEMFESALGKVGIKTPKSATAANLDSFSKLLEAARANAETMAYAEVAGEIYDGGHDAFAARCKAATTRTEELVEVYERSLALSCIPKAAITKTRCKLIADEAGHGYSQRFLELDSSIETPEGLTHTQFRPTRIMQKVEEELAEQPVEERLANLCRRRKLALQRDKPEEELLLFNEQKAAASSETLNYKLKVPCFNQANWDEAERAFNVAEAVRKGRQHPVASARWRLPLDPSMKLAPPADALRKCKKYLVLTDEVEFEELGELVKSLEHGAKCFPHNYPVS